MANCVLEYKRWPPTFMVYCYLLRCNNAKNGCFPSKATIAESCGVAGSSVDKAIDELTRKGMVEVEHRFSNGHQQSNLYKLLYLDEVWKRHYTMRMLPDDIGQMWRLFGQPKV